MAVGVAWSAGPQWPEPKTLQHWPGKLGHELRNKVDSAVSYNIESGDLVAWGFLCDPENEQYDHNELFKLYLDPAYQDTFGAAPSLAEAQKWFRDYLSQLRSCIVRQFEESTPHFDTKKIEYVFSVPTTWKNPAILADIERLINEAGFGRGSKVKASIYLTEAEAAAVYISKQSMQYGDIFLVCDAGGGTTDLNVLKMSSVIKDRVELEPLSWTEGMAVGSTLIDFKVRRLLIDRLSKIQEHMTGDLEAIVSRMMQDRFATFKCSFGSEGMDVEKLFLPVPDLHTGQNYPEAHVEDSRMVLSREELQAIFDEQITKMCGLLDRQFKVVEDSHLDASVSYLLLSGGLGSSPYVRKKIKARYEQGRLASRPNARNLKVLLATEPQLAVVHGLVMARIQASRGGPGVYSKRCCPVSLVFSVENSTTQQSIMLKELSTTDTTIRNGSSNRSTGSSSKVR